MAGLVDYDSSSSSSCYSGSDSWSKKRVRTLQTDCSECSEVSLSETQRLTKGDGDQSTDDPAALLEELGCSPDLISHAMSVCEEGTPVSDLFDFIQAYKCSLEDPENVPQLKEGGALLTGEECGFEPGESLTWPGSKSKKVASFSRISSAMQRDNRGDEGQLTGNPATQLEEFGCSPESISYAMSVCDEGTPVSDLFDFIQAYKCSLEEKLRREVVLPVADNNVPLKGWGDGGSLFTAEKSDLKGIPKFTLQRGESSKEASSSRISSVNVYMNEEFEGEAVQKQKGKDFTSHSFKKAFASYEIDDIQGFLDDLDAFEGPSKKTEVTGVQEYMHANQTAQAESSRSSLLNSEAIGSLRYDFNKKVEANKIDYMAKGVSRPESNAAIQWTHAHERSWVSYMGGPKKLRSSILQDTDDGVEMFQTSWEDATKVSTGCKRKLHATGCKIMEDVKPRVGKMMGFGIPGFSIGRPKELPCSMAGPPLFYFENVAGVPNKEWETIKLHFNGVEPEFTDSKFFSASRRPRGYVHNLPVEGRRVLQHAAPMTIFEVFPHMKKYWPCWDTRQKLNCINTRKAPDKLCGLIRTLFTLFEGKEIPYQKQQEIVQVCKKWNLVWVGPGKAAPLEPHEIEVLLGFDQDHTRGCASMTERYDALGNSFQVDTVAYHLSPLKALYPNGITLLSLFSGIGGAEVALGKAGVYLKVVIAVEINEKVRGVLAAWWRRSGQKGQLRLKNDAREMTYDVLAQLIDEVGPIDLIIGGSPCNNLSGNNRVSRFGLNGSESSLFFEFPRILNIVKQVMRDRGFL